MARHHAEIRYPKQCFVDEIKRKIGKCATCSRPVLRGQEQAFIFDHYNALEKMRGGLARKHGGVAGLVNNNVKESALHLIRGVLWHETTICRLLCHNCNHLKTHYPHLWEGDRVGRGRSFGLEDIEYGKACRACE